MKGEIVDKFRLNETYNFDVTFNENSFGHLILSPNRIIIIQNLQHNFANFANQEGMKVLQCFIQPDNTPVTLFNLKKINENSIISSTTFDVSSSIIYICDCAIIGKHYNNINEIKICGITIEQNSVRQWLEANYINVNPNPNNTTSIVIPNIPQTIYEHDFNDFSLSFNFIPTFQMSSQNDNTYSTCYEINFHFNNNNDINTSLKYISRWQILHTLFTGQINNFDTISFSIPLEKPIIEQEKEMLKQNMMKMFNDAEEELVNKFIEAESEQTPTVNFYMPFPKTYEEQLHFLKVPITYLKIEKMLDNILEKWFKLDNNMSQSIIYFLEALDKNKDVYQRFLLSTKLIEAFAEKYSETYFPETEINQIKNFIKNKLKEYYKDTMSKVIKDFTDALKYTNKNKINLEGRINKLIENNNIDYLNLNKEIVNHATNYRNTLSHSVDINQMESIDFDILYECYLKFLTFGFVLLWKYLDIPSEVISYGVKMIKPYQELEVNGKLKLKEEEEFIFNEVKI